MSHAMHQDRAKSPPDFKEEPAPVADDLHHPHPSPQGLPASHHQHQRGGVVQQQRQPDSPHQSGTSHPAAQGPYASPHPSQHQSPYVGSIPGPSGQLPQDHPYYAAPSPYSTGSAAGSYSSGAEQGELGMATATMNRAQFPPIYHTPQSNSPSSVQSPQEQYGRHMYGQTPGSIPQGMYPYPLPQQSPYGQHHPAQQHPQMPASFLNSQQQGPPLPHQTSHPHTPGMTGSPKSRMSSTPMARPPSGVGPPQAGQPGPPTSAAGVQGPPGAPNVNPNAAPGPIPATTPLVVRQDQNGVQWIAFEYSRDRVKMEYTIRCDVESVNVDELPQEFKTENCVYPRACCSKDQYKGNRLLYETECNTVGWALAQLNACLRGKRGLIQRAVDSWRNSNQDPRLRSRRVRRMAKISNRKAVQAAQHGTHMPGSGGPGAAGVSNPAGAGLAAGPGPRQPGMSMGGQQLHHHHEHPGGGAPGSNEDVSASNDYNDGPQTHHHQAPNGQGSSSDVRSTHNFYPTYPTPASSGNPSMPSLHSTMDRLGSHASSHSATVATAKQEEGERNIALFGDLPEAKRRKFILVDDAQRGTRVRVRVMLDQVQMEEMPDSYRKSNSVYPRSYFPTQMQSPPTSPRGSRFFDDPEDDSEEGGVAGMAPTTGRTLVSVPMMDGSEAKVPKPRLTRAKRRKEVTLNDLGYRMSWSQSRVFSGRTLFLQRSLDAYRNKMRATMIAASQDVGAVAPHFETRVGKRKWLERSKRAKREPTP